MLILVSYDVPDDRRRTKLANALKDFGERVQYSVFEFLLDEAQINRLHGRIESLVDTAEDSVRIYRFCSDCGAKLEIVGLGVVTEDPKMYIV